jgi:hypothetical protein
MIVAGASCCAYLKILLKSIPCDELINNNDLIDIINTQKKEIASLKNAINALTQ